MPARCPQRLRTAYAALLSGPSAPPLAALCRAAAYHRTAFNHRLVVEAGGPCNDAECASNQPQEQTD